MELNQVQQNISHHRNHNRYHYQLQHHHHLRFDSRVHVNLVRRFPSRFLHPVPEQGLRECPSSHPINSVEPQKDTGALIPAFTDFCQDGFF